MSDLSSDRRQNPPERRTIDDDFVENPWEDESEVESPGYLPPLLREIEQEKRLRIEAAAREERRKREEQFKEESNRKQAEEAEEKRKNQQVQEETRLQKEKAERDLILKQKAERQAREAEREARQIEEAAREARSQINSTAGEAGKTAHREIQRDSANQRELSKGSEQSDFIQTNFNMLLIIATVTAPITFILTLLGSSSFFPLASCFLSILLPMVPFTILYANFLLNRSSTAGHTDCIDFDCSNCGSEFSVKATQAGARGHCDICNEPLVVPRQSTITPKVDDEDKRPTDRETDLAD